MEEDNREFTRRPITRRQLLRGAVVTSLGLAGFSALAACQSPTPAPSKPAAPAAPAQGGAAAGTKADAKAPKLYAAPPGKEVNPIRGGTVKSFYSSSQHVDPTLTTASFPNQQWGKVHGGNGLVRPRGDHANDMVWIPHQLQSWEMAKDGLSWTLKLRNDVYWQDIPPVNGRKFISKDVGYAIDYYNTKGIYTYLWGMVNKWETPDDTTIILRLKEPSALVYGTMTAYYAEMLPREVAEKYGDFKNEAGLIGTGPWMVDSIDAKTRWTFKRNPKYFEKGVDGQPLPYIEKFDIAVIPDYASELAALRARQLDLWMQPGGNGPMPGDIPGLRQSNPEYIIHEEYRPVIYRVEFNARKAPFNDARNRIAVSKAIDRQALLDGIFEGQGVWTSWVPAVLEGYTLPPDRTKQAFAYDPAGAKKLFQETGLDKQTWAFIGRESSWYKKMAEVCHQMIKEAGSPNVELKIVDQTALYNLQQTNEWLAYVYVGVPTDQEPNNHIGALFQSDSPRNMGGFSDKKLDDMLKAANSEMDEVKRKKAFIDIQEYMLTIMPHAPLITDTRFKTLPPWLVNMPEVHWTYIYPRLERAWLDDSKRVK